MSEGQKPVEERGAMGEPARLTDPTERLYYRDSFLREFDARVISCEREGERWKIVLDRTAFYPTSGGQPYDTGKLGDVPVIEVADADHKVVHYASAAIAVGTVHGVIDWPRRIEHMQQHTGQHLLSAVFLRELHAPTVSFHLGESISTIDLACAPPAYHSLERVERIANEIIAEDRPVTTRSASRGEAEAMLAAGELRKLPDREGSIRLIEIADCDRNACGGTHVRSTGQIGGLLVRGVEKVTRGVRIEFACGLRAVSTARTDAAIVSETAALLSIPGPELPQAVRRLQGDAKAGARERQKLREELAVFHGAGLASEASVENGLRLVVRAWKDRDRDYVRLLASRTAAALPGTAVIFSAQEVTPSRVYIARSKDLGFDCGRMLKEALANIGLRGGGSPDLAQGDVPIDQEQALVASLADTVRRSVAHT